MISGAVRVAADRVVAAIATTTGIAGRVRMAAATDTRTTDAETGISGAGVDRAADRAARETRMIADRAGTISSSRAARCVRPSSQ